MTSCASKTGETESESVSESTAATDIIIETENNDFDPNGLVSSLELEDGDSRSEFLKAFFASDAARMGELLALSEKDAQILCGIEIAGASAKFGNTDQSDRYLWSVDLTVDVTESDSKLIPAGENLLRIYNDGFLCDVYLEINPTESVTDEKTSAQSAVLSWMYICGIDVPLGEFEAGDERENALCKIGDYLGNYYGIRELDEYERLAEEVFGMSDFEPRIPLMQLDDGTWIPGGHGAIMYRFEMLPEETLDDGRVSVKVKFMSDYNGLVEAGTVEYILSPTGEELNGTEVYRFDEVIVPENFTPFAYQF